MDTAPDVLTPAQLQEAFEKFEQASAIMTTHYERLQQEVADLNVELETKNRELSKSLAQTEAFGLYLESLLDNLTNGVLAVDAAGRIATLNHAAETMLGQSRERLLRQPIETALPPLAPYGVMNDDGSGGEDETAEVSFESPADPEEIRVIEVQARSAPNPSDQKPVRLIVMRDVTDLRRLQRAANLCNRLTAMGEMAMNVAHEVRNPLGSIELFASALRQEVDGDEEKRRLVDFISQGVRSIDNIVNNILMFARQMDPSLESVEPGALLDEVLAYAQLHMEQKDIELKRTDRAGKALCLGDVELLKQVFLNLFLNATQAMEPGGTLKLRTSASARMVKFVVEDNGPGMPPTTLSKIFDPFFTTRRRGTGLGLTICHNIIQAHEGAIDVESEVGQGTKFIISIPRA